MPKYEIESEKFAFAEKEYLYSKRAQMKELFLNDTGAPQSAETDRIMFEERMEDEY